MNRKNRILTMLACLNCVHTTHAVDKRIKSGPVGNVKMPGVIKGLDKSLINETIKLRSPKDIGTLKSLLKSMRIDPETYDMVLCTIHDNLDGADPDLQYKTIALLAADPELAQDVYKMFPMALAKRLETLRAQYLFQGMVCSAMYILKDPNRMHDALMEGAQIMWALDKHMTDALSQDDPVRPDYEALVSIRREIVEEIKSLNKNDLINADVKSGSLFTFHLDDRLNKKLQSLFAERQIKLDEQMIKNMTGVYLHFWYTKYPQLDHTKGMDYAPFPSPISSRTTLSTIRHAIRKGNLEDVLSGHDNRMKGLANRYPDIAKQTWDVNSELWAHDVNRLLYRWAQGETFWLDNLGNVLQQLDHSGTQLGKVMAKASLDQIRNNLMGQDKDLKEKTNMLLAKDTKLTQMVFDGPDGIQPQDMLVGKKVRIVLY